LDKIILEITTDGTLSPNEALGQSAALLLQQFLVFANYWTPVDVPKESPVASNVPIPPSIYEMPIEEVGLPSRVYNSVKRAGIAKVGHVLEKDRVELLALRNIGEKTLQDLSEYF